MLAVDLLGLTQDAINDLFQDPNNPRRLKQPLDGVSIDAAIENADNLLSQLQAVNADTTVTGPLQQKLGLAKGLRMLSRYYTDLSMTSQTDDGKNPAEVSLTKSSIDSLGITDQNFKRILDDLIASVEQSLSSSSMNRKKGKTIDFCFLSFSSK